MSSSVSHTCLIADEHLHPTEGEGGGGGGGGVREKREGNPMELPLYVNICEG